MIDDVPHRLFRWQSLTDVELGNRSVLKGPFCCFMYHNLFSYAFEFKENSNRSHEFEVKVVHHFTP